MDDNKIQINQTKYSHITFILKKKSTVIKISFYKFLQWTLNILICTWIVN